MKKRIILVLLSLLLMIAAVAPAMAEGGAIITPTTGYTSASEVVYKEYTAGGRRVLANWGARGEAATFLSTYAEAYYTGDYTYEAMSANAGGSSTSDAYTSELYKALNAMMTAKHTHTTDYNETRDYYRYTDCVANDKENFSSFYSGTSYNGTWVGGSNTPWNREHTWPKSKGIKDTEAADDIMMLRPTLTSENSGRGNTAYGEGGGYFDPGESVRGDCARIVLYVYTRWKATSTMWGTGGVIESLDILLKWMEEDPVDTWEMGRNDSVESLTGVRNVFVDYPELAWQMFGREVPENYTTPSSESREDNVTSGEVSDTSRPEESKPQSVVTSADVTSPPDYTNDENGGSTVTIAIITLALVGVTVAVIAVKKRK